jgi:hypothetical protein
MLEALLKGAMLAAVESEQRRSDGQAGKRAVDHAPRDALGLRVARHGAEETVEVAATGCRTRRHGDQWHDEQ